MTGYSAEYIAKHGQPLDRTDYLSSRPNAARTMSRSIELDNAIAAALTASECVLWPGVCNQYGYPQRKIKQKMRLVTHVVLEMGGFPRPAPPDDKALHSCPDEDNPRCITLAHLRWGGASENGHESWIERG